MKARKVLIGLAVVLSSIALTACEKTDYEVTATITDKDVYEQTLFTTVWAGKSAILVPYINTYYRFHFNEVKEYIAHVSSSTFDAYEVGDNYTFRVTQNDAEEYFYESSYRYVEE